MTPESTPLVSVVTPFYNTQNYLAECIESVLAQIYQNWEYILVNNCSTDRSPQIAKQYAEKDRRLRVIDNEKFLSQVQNYNHALRQISIDSEYCKIVQADDWIFPECLSRMVAVAEYDSRIGLVSSYRLDDGRLDCLGLPKDREVFDGHEVCRSQLRGGSFLFGSPTTVLYRSNLVRGRTSFFSETSLHEDTEVCYEILEHSRFGFVHQALSFTRRENESTSSKVREYNPNLLDKFIVLSKYGRVYLQAKECRDRLTKWRSSYYDFLADSLKARREREFWEYHRRGLATIGENLSFFRVAGFLLKKQLNRIVQPHGDKVRMVLKKLGDRGWLS